MASSSLNPRSRRFRTRHSERAPALLVAVDAGDDGSATEGESDSSASDYDADLESMAGKGIKRLCSELLELKKSSEQDFQRNLYSNHSAFVRIFEEAGSMECELVELKRHVLTQKRLVQVLLDNLCSDIVLDHSPESNNEESEYLNLCSPDDIYGAERCNVLEKLDILLSEHRVEEALHVLETDLVALQEPGTEQDHASPIIGSFMSAVLKRRTRLADWFASVAGHPRVSAAELQKALSGLCRLGESHRANKLLLKFYGSRLASNIHELDRVKPFVHQTYIAELAKIVFSTISQATRSIVMLYGETSPYTSELIEWARDETETFCCSFAKYVKSISEASGGLAFAVEAVNTVLSYCSLLNSQKIVLHPDLVKLIRPSMEEVLQMHVDQFKKVVGICTATDNWVLGKFLILGILRENTSLAAIHGKLEYCLLTSSGRQFVTLMQAIVDDISSLVILQMESSILKGLADLFNEYMHTLKRAIPNKVKAVEDDYPSISSAQTLPQQISLLVSSSTLARLFASIAACVFKGNRHSNNKMTENAQVASHKEFDSWMVSIQDAADQLKAYFCQQFVYEIMSDRQPEQTTEGNPYTDGQCKQSSTENLMPSTAFQVVFLQLRQLEELSKSNFNIEDGFVEKLGTELLKGVIDWLSNKQEFWNDTEDCWLSNKQEFWNDTEDCSFEQQKRCYMQFHLDMHFLLEIARNGAYYSDDLWDAALDLIEQQELAFTEIHSHINSLVPDDEWVLSAAKLAIEKLQKVGAAKSQLRVEPLLAFEEEARMLEDDDEDDDDDDDNQADDELAEVDTVESKPRVVDMDSFGEEVSIRNGEVESPSDVENDLLISDYSLELRECQSECSTGTDTAELTETRSIESESPEGDRRDEKTTDYDDKDCRGHSIPFVDMNDGQNASEAVVRLLNVMEGTKEADAEGSVSLPEEGLPVKSGESQCMEENENPGESKLFKGSVKLDETTSYLNNVNETLGAPEVCNELLTPDAAVYDDVDRSPLDSKVEGDGIFDDEVCMTLDFHNTSESVDLNQSSLNTTSETMKDDCPILTDSRTKEVQDYGIEGELPDRNTELGLEGSPDRQGGDGIGTVSGYRNSSSNSVRPKGGRERERERELSGDVSAGDLVGRNRKPMRASRPRWH